MALARGEACVAGVVATAVGVSPRGLMPREEILTYVYEWAWTVWASGPRQRPGCTGVIASREGETTTGSIDDTAGGKRSRG